MRPTTCLALVATIAALGLGQEKPVALPFVVESPPEGLADRIPEPAGNPGTPEKVALGRDLFFDPMLSIDKTVSCASCHKPDHGWSDDVPFSLGFGEKRALRHTPSLFNRAWGESFMWDGAHKTLEEQVLQPVSNPNEMGLPLKEAVARVRANESYGARFRKVFGGEPNADAMAQALAAFVRRIVIGDSPVDRFHRGESDALNTLEKRGLWIFESKGKCWRCHDGSNFTNESWHNTGIGAKDGKAELGRAGVTKKDSDRGRFKTPTLRGLTMTAPYMHDGSLATLEDVVIFYRDGGHANPLLDKRVEKLDLDDDDVAAMVAFLRALSR